MCCWFAGPLDGLYYSHIGCRQSFRERLTGPGPLYPRSPVAYRNPYIKGTQRQFFINFHDFFHIFILRKRVGRCKHWRGSIDKPILELLTFGSNLDFSDFVPRTIHFDWKSASGFPRAETGVEEFLQRIHVTVQADPDNHATPKHTETASLMPGNPCVRDLRGFYSARAFNVSSVRYFIRCWTCSLSVADKSSTCIKDAGIAICHS